MLRNGSANVEIFKSILEQLTGVDYWIASGFLLVGTTLWLWIGATKRQEKRVLERQVIGSSLLLFFAGLVIWLNHFFFQQEPVFSKKLTGILVMRIIGDNASNSLQGDLVETLNGQLQKEPTGQQIEVHAGRETIDADNGLAPAHEQAREIGQRLNAKLVIWGRVGTGAEDKLYAGGTARQFYPRITVVTTPKGWSAESQRTLQNIDEVGLPKEFVDQPFYLINFAAGYSFFVQSDYKEALPRFEAALQREGGLPNELADLQFFTAFCASALSEGQKDMSDKLQEAINLYEESAKTYKSTDLRRWARTQNNLGNAYGRLPAGDQTANLQKAIAAYNAALQIYTENDFRDKWAAIQNNLGTAYSALPTGVRGDNLNQAIVCYKAALRVYTKQDSAVDWARLQNNLGIVYNKIPNGDRASNLQKAITCYEAALLIRTEKDYPTKWAMTQNNLGNTYCNLTTGDRTTNLQKAIAAFSAALRVFKEKEYPTDWAMTQTNLGTAYGELPSGDRVANLQKATAAFNEALRVYTEKDFPTDWAMTENNLGYAYDDLPAGDQAAKPQQAIVCYEAALRIRAEKDFPVEWAETQNNLGKAYDDLRTGDRIANLHQAIACYEAALRVRTEKDFPAEWAETQFNLGTAYDDLSIGIRISDMQMAKACLKSALKVYTENSFPEYHHKAAVLLERIEEQLKEKR